MGKKTYLLENKKLNRFKFSFPFVSNLKQVPPLAQCDEPITTLTIEGSMAMVHTW
jgi:hypothetical protein